MPSDTTIVRVELGERSYDIQIGTGNLGQAGALLSECHALTHAILITDENVEQPHAQVVADSLAGQGAAVDVLVLEPGEATKSIDAAAVLWEKILAQGADRATAVVAVGGGVIGDLAGFVAATYARGLPLLQVPTTLLAHVDSSVGGKVGINLPGAKNMVGAFWQPVGVVIDTEVLGTLPDREYRSGLAEVVKYGVVLDADFFAYLEGHVGGLNDREHSVMEHIIAQSCRLKAEVVQADEREISGRRAVLNFGHTFAHAFEAVTGYETLLHGEAVSIGMLCAARLAESLGRVDANFVQRLSQLLAALGLATEVPDLDGQQILSAMQNDKKVQHGRLRFVLPTRMGHVELVENVDANNVAAALG